MKTKSISMMLMGVMMLCTTTSFGKTTTVKNKNTHTTVVTKKTPDKNCHCRNCENIRKEQQHKTINYCDCKNCKNQKVSTKKCEVMKKGQSCTCKNCKTTMVSGRSHMKR